MFCFGFAAEAQEEERDPFEVDPFEADHLVVTGSNIPSDNPPWVPELIFNRKSVERS